jgi:hypothetical protein
MQSASVLRELGPVEQHQFDNVVHTLSVLGTHGESLAEVVHDARNMVTALDLYCDLLQEPGVLAGPFVHYGDELRLVAAASRRLLDKLVSVQQVGAPVDSKTHLPRVHPDLWPVSAENPTPAVENRPGRTYPPPRLEALLPLPPAGLLSPALTSLSPPRPTAARPPSP